MANEDPGHTLNYTALVHEAYLRLVGNHCGDHSSPEFATRGHFFAAAAEAMRRILVERARHKRRIKHGGSVKRADLNLELVAAPDDDEEVLALDEALEKLKGEDPVKAQ